MFFTERQILDKVGEGVSVSTATDSLSGDKAVLVERKDFMLVLAMLMNNMNELERTKASRGMAGEKAS